MKTLLFIPLILISLGASAQKLLVESGTTRTVRGIGGHADIAYAFAQGDVVTVEAEGSKLLQQVMAYVYPEAPVLGRVKSVRDASLVFSVPEDAIVIIRFISDRPGVNTVKYTVSRTPASEATRHYNTRVEWQKPKDRVGPRIPKRISQLAN